MQLASDGIGQADFKTVQSLIYQYAGISLSDAKHVMVHSRLAKRLREYRFSDYAEYLQFLQSPDGAEERVHFINCLTTNKTDFFRENHHFEFLKSHVFPEIGRHGKLRVWSAACSSGEEAYSVAMCIREYFSEYADTLILATDIDTCVLQKATQGIYRPEQVAGVPRIRLTRFFDTVSHNRQPAYRVKECLRELVKFGRLNFNDRTWPISQGFDVIFCRNAMIYFNPDTQKRLVERFASLINPGGYLIIGHSESLHGVTDSFEAVGGTIYKLRSAIQARPVVNQPPPTLNSTSISHLPDAPTDRPISIDRHQARQPLSKQADSLSIRPGQAFASAKPTWCTSLVGSGICLCLFDEAATAGGMNQFLLPPQARTEAAGAEYVDRAIQSLIKCLVEQGAQLGRLKAKLFGGATIQEAPEQLNHAAKRSLQYARTFLKRHRIPVVAEQVGGSQALYLKFLTTEFTAQTKQLDQAASKQVASIEAKCQLATRFTDN